MKKKIHKAKSKSFSILNVIAKVLFYMALCVVIYALIIIPILTSVLKHHGIRCEAIITSGESAPFYTRYSTNDYLYEFTIDEKTYTGNSLIKVGNTYKIGDSIEILYFNKWPSFNRPISYYDK